MNISWPGLLVICGGLIAVVLILALPIPRFRAKARTRIDRRPTPAIFRDDDRYWYGGIIYNNPDDPEVFVPKRYGLGWTLNFGHPQGKLFFKLFLFGMLLLMLMPLVVALLGTFFPGSIHSYGCHPSGCHPGP